MLAFKEKLDNIHFEHNMWLNELAFYLGEIAIYENRLLAKYTVSAQDDIPAKIIEVADQLKRQKKLANDLSRVIKKHVSNINQLARSNGELNKIANSTHPKVRLQMAVFRKDYVAWKEAFHQFLEGQI